MLGPIPRRSLWCPCPLLPRGHRPSPCRERLGTPRYPYSDFRTGDITGLQSFSNVQASGFACHPDRSYRCAITQGSRGFYVRAYYGLLPPRTSDMLAARIGQLTAWGLTPHQIRGLAGRSPDPISANLSLDACTPTPVSSVVRLLVSSHKTSAFPPLGQGRLHTNTIRTATSVRYAFSRLQAFSNVHASRFARHPGRSYRCAITDTQGSRDFYVRAEHRSLPSRASDILAA